MAVATRWDGREMTLRPSHMAGSTKEIDAKEL